MNNFFWAFKINLTHFVLFVCFFSFWVAAKKERANKQRAIKIHTHTLFVKSLIIMTSSVLICYYKWG